MNPPVLHFQTKIFHPNIHFESGEVCLDVLKQEWNPQWTIESVIRAVGLMLMQPNADSPLNCDAGNASYLKYYRRQPDPSWRHGWVPFTSRILHT